MSRGQPGVDRRCVIPSDCPKYRDPGAISWANGCWCYRNQQVPAAGVVMADLVDVAMRAQQEHYFANPTTCTCGFQPGTSGDWARHRMAVALDAVADWLAGHASDVLANDRFIRAADWAADLIRADAA